MKLFRSIHTVTINTFTLPPHHATNSYVIGGDREAVLIDPIYKPGNPLDICLTENRIGTIQYAAVTHPHPDHYGGIDHLLAAHGGRILCHARTADPTIFGASDLNLIQRFSGGECIQMADFTLQVLHAPGHSAAHLCFYIPEEGILFSGDTILGRGTSIISPPEGDMADYMETLRILASMDIQVICPAHGPIIDQHAPERIQWYIAHRMMRETLVLEALEEGLSDISLITLRIYSEEDFQMHGHDLQPRAERTVLSHLQKLEKEGLVVRKTDVDGTHYHIS